MNPDKVVAAALHQLGEHFDAVQILVSWKGDNGTTLDIFDGTGNWYARTGMAHEFLTRDECDTMRQMDDDDGEEEANK